MDYFTVGGNNTTLNFASFKNPDGADNYRSFMNIMRKLRERARRPSLYFFFV